MKQIFMTVMSISVIGFLARGIWLIIQSNNYGPDAMLLTALSGMVVLTIVKD